MFLESLGEGPPRAGGLPSQEPQVAVVGRSKPHESGLLAPANAAYSVVKMGLASLGFIHKKKKICLLDGKGLGQGSTSWSQSVVSSPSCTAGVSVRPGNPTRAMFLTLGV